jgi:hypothetical protein
MRPALGDPVDVVEDFVHLGDVVLPGTLTIGYVGSQSAPRLTGWCSMTFRMTNDRHRWGFRTAPAVDVQWHFRNGRITEAHQQNYQWPSSWFRLDSVNPRSISARGGPAVTVSAQYNYTRDWTQHFTPRRTVQLRMELGRVGDRCSASGSWTAYSW